MSPVSRRNGIERFVLTLAAMALVGPVFTAGSADGAMLNVRNHSFESPTQASDDGNNASTSPGAVDDWTFSGGGHYGVLNPSDDEYTGATDGDPDGELPAPGDQKQVTFVGQGAQANLTQSLQDSGGSPILLQELDYTLTVALGNRGDSGSDAGETELDAGMGAWQIELLAGGSVIASNSGGPEGSSEYTSDGFAPDDYPAADGGFADVTAAVTGQDIQNNHSALVGEQLGIRLTRGPDPDDEWQANFDNVRLTVVPEPTSLALLAPAGLLALRRRRR